MVIPLATAGVLALVLIAELLHGRRCRRLSRLAFGPNERPMAWVFAVPILRPAAAALLTWGLLTLMDIEPKVHRADYIEEDEYQHMVIVLDVSPSMRLQDAGPEGDQSRRARAKDVLDSLFSRVSMSHWLISVIATYNGAKPVVVDTKDAEVVRNILADLPMHYAFLSGKTKLFDGLTKAAETAKTWDRNSAVLVVVSDGDTVPSTGMPKLPPSIKGTLVIGVGDPLVGKFIDGQQSRQDASTLRQMSARLRGDYHNANKQHVPSDMIRRLTEASDESPWEKLTLREYALLAVALGSSLLALLPLLLHFAGTTWRPGVPDAATPFGKTSMKEPRTLPRRSAVAR